MDACRSDLGQLTTIQREGRRICDVPGSSRGLPRRSAITNVASNIKAMECKTSSPSI
jgi:hypothetical protein